MRSKNKGFFIDKPLTNTESNGIKSKKIWSRRSVITPKMVDKNLEVHNGKQFIAVKINSSMVGHKLGEFSFTRKIYQYKKGKKK